MIKIIKLATFTTISASLLLLSVSLHAEIYKWVDENGGVHYTAQPPMNKKRVKVKNIEQEIRAAAGKYRPPASTKSTSQDKDAQKSDQSNVNPEELAGPDDKLVKYCKNQRNNLEQLKKNFRNVWVDAKGKKTNLDQEQRKEKVAFLQTRINEDCKDIK